MNSPSAPLERYLRLGILHFMAYPVGDGTGPILPTLARLANDSDFDRIEISWIRDEQERIEARALLAASGMEIGYAAHPRILSRNLDLGASDEERRRQSVRELHEALDEAIAMGAADLCLLSGPYPGEAHEQAALDATVRSLHELCERGDRDGIRITLEVFDRSVEKRCLIGPAAIAAELAQRVRERTPSFGLVVDLSHTPLLGESPAQALHPVREHLAHVHLGNCLLSDPDHPAYGDKHPRLGYPGGVNGAPETAAFLETLFEIGYLDPAGKRRATASFEVKPVAGEDPDMVIAASKRVLRDAWYQHMVDPARRNGG